MALKLERWGDGSDGYSWRIIPTGGPRPRHIAYFTEDEIRDLVRQACLSELFRDTDSFDNLVTLWEYEASKRTD